jgi:hypothetical protein
MESAAATLSYLWGAEALQQYQAPARQAEVEDIERRYGLTLPDDFRAYLLQTAPAEEYWDDGNAFWWSVVRINNIPDEYDHPIGHPRIASNAHSYLFFADFLLWAWAWAICCGEGEDRGKVAVIGGDPDHFVADSFSQFVELYVKNPESVF